jgi:putative oxidoreductase
MNKKLQTLRPQAYLLFRILIGIMLFFHGIQKFGLLEGGFGLPTSTLMTLVAIIETIGGIMIATGFYTSIAAITGGIVMIGAIIKVHLPTSIYFVNNGAEMAFLYLAAFLILATFGGGEKAVLKSIH